MTTCTRRLEFDAAHRVVGHEGKCAHLHGHRYGVEITCVAASLDPVGRVVDFGEIKRLVGTWIDDHLDHGAILHAGDEALLRVLRQGGHRVHVMPEGNPTAEILAEELLQTARVLLAPSGIGVLRVRVYETPNCWADAGEGV